MTETANQPTESTRITSFNDLAGRLSELEDTAGRNAVVRQLADILRAVPDEILAAVVYLLQGRIAPRFETVQFGLAERSVEAGIAAAYGVTDEEVRRLYAESGDLGGVAFSLNPRTAPQPGPNIAHVIAVLREIAAAAGPGSAGRRLEMLQSLLAQLDAFGAKYLVRMVLDQLRLGVGDITIIDALAATTDNRNRRQTRATLEAAYNRTSDLGEVALTLRREGLPAVESLPVVPGHPIRPELAERLPSAESIIERLGRVISQNKYDGIRVQIHKAGAEVRVFSRNEQDMTEAFAELPAAVRLQVKVDSAILDGEALGYDPLSEEFVPFQMTARRRRKHDIGEAMHAVPLVAFIFDLLYVEGASIMDEPLERRLATLQQVVRPDTTLRLAESELIDDVTRLTEAFDSALTRGLEGLVVKRPDSPYVAGARNLNWVKLKRHSTPRLEDTIDCVILGYFIGRGKRAELGAGALLLGVYNARAERFETVSRLGTGLSDDEWREIVRLAAPLRLDHRPARVDSLITPSVWLQPQIVVEVLADEITRSPIHTAGRHDDHPGYALRFPRLLSLRTLDKQPEDATTVQELEGMYR